MLKRYAGALIGGFVLKRALPIAKIATVATKNIALTYAIGMRAQAVARFRNAELDEWPKLMRQVTNIDESTLVEWATSAARTAIDQVQDSARSWVGRVTSLLPSLPDLRRLVPGSREEPEAVSDEPAPAPAKARRAPRKAAVATPAPSPSVKARAKTGKAAQPTKPAVKRAGKAAAAPAAKPRRKARKD